MCPRTQRTDPPPPSGTPAPGQPPSGGSHFNDRARAAAFVAFLEAHRGQRHVVALQDYPDPDAISSALAYRMIGERYGIQVDIAYEGRVSHQENLALIHLLDIELTRFSDSLPLDHYDGAVYIDNQGTTTKLTDRLAEAAVPTVAIIDHHAPQGILEPTFLDIRPVGAAATILVDYIRCADVLPMDVENEAHVRLATALTHGLRSETNGFIRAGPEEFAAGAYLAPFVDTERLEHILRVQRTRGTMDVIRDALAGRTVRGGYAIAGVGYLRHTDRDAIPQATDFLLTEENVHTAIAYGILVGEGEREAVVGSVRTSKLTMDVDQFLKGALGSDFRGRYYGGGRSRAGGFEIPVGFLEGITDEDQMRLKWETFDHQIRTRILRTAGLLEDDED
jgi:nanoRNase/pAp phosphatase (c-di-AMP/oligoRNAs hydrolase)